MSLRFVPGDRYLQGIPARDLTDKDLERLGRDRPGLVKELLASGIYVKPTTKKKEPSA